MSSWRWWVCIARGYDNTLQLQVGVQVIVCKWVCIAHCASVCVQVSVQVGVHVSVQQGVHCAAGISTVITACAYINTPLLSLSSCLRKCVQRMKDEQGSKGIMYTFFQRCEEFSQLMIAVKCREQNPLICCKWEVGRVRNLIIWKKKMCIHASGVGGGSWVLNALWKFSSILILHI